MPSNTLRRRSVGLADFVWQRAIRQTGGSGRNPSRLRLDQASARAAQQHGGWTVSSCRGRRRLSGWQELCEAWHRRVDRAVARRPRSIWFPSACWTPTCPARASRTARVLRPPLRASRPCETTTWIFSWSRTRRPSRQFWFCTPRLSLKCSRVSWFGPKQSQCEHRSSSLAAQEWMTRVQFSHRWRILVFASQRLQETLP